MFFVLCPCATWLSETCGGVRSCLDTKCCSSFDRWPLRDAALLVSHPTRPSPAAAAAAVPVRCNSCRRVKLSFISYLATDLLGATQPPPKAMRTTWKPPGTRSSPAGRANPAGQSYPVTSADPNWGRFGQRFALRVVCLNSEVRSPVAHPDGGLEAGAPVVLSPGDAVTDGDSVTTPLRQSRAINCSH